MVVYIYTNNTHNSWLNLGKEMTHKALIAIVIVILLFLRSSHFIREASRVSL